MYTILKNHSLRAPCFQGSVVGRPFVDGSSENLLLALSFLQRSIEQFGEMVVIDCLGVPSNLTAYAEHSERR